VQAPKGQESHPLHHPSWCGRVYLYLRHFEST